MRCLSYHSYALSMVFLNIYVQAFFVNNFNKKSILLRVTIHSVQYPLAVPVLNISLPFAIFLENQPEIWVRLATAIFLNFVFSHVLLSSYLDCINRDYMYSNLDLSKFCQWYCLWHYGARLIVIYNNSKEYILVSVYGFTHTNATSGPLI